VVNDLAMCTDQKLWSDARVRRAVSLALNRREIIEATLGHPAHPRARYEVMPEGEGVVNGPMAAALTDWALPIDQLGEGARFCMKASRLRCNAGRLKK
jgi:ABC-type transport system substrate-binding protein